MLDTAGHVGPAAVRLALGDIVPPPGTDHGAGVAHVGLGAVAGEPGARHQAGHCGTAWDQENIRHQADTRQTPITGDGVSRSTRTNLYLFSCGLPIKYYQTTVADKLSFFISEFTIYLNLFALTGLV